MSIRMRSNKPYLIRAFYDWIIDNNCTAIMAIDALHPKCQVPQEFVEDGEIVFNVSPAAIRDFNVSNSAVEFKASFSGIVHLIYAPIKAIMAVYAEQNNEGIFFDADEDYDEEEDEPTVSLTAIQGSGAGVRPESDGDTDGSGGSGKKAPFLRVIK